MAEAVLKLVTAVGVVAIFGCVLVGALWWIGLLFPDDEFSDEE